MLVEPNIEALPTDMSMHSLTDTADALERAQIHVLLVKHREFASMSSRGADLLVIDAAGVLAA